LKKSLAYSESKAVVFLNLSFGNRAVFGLNKTEKDKITQNKNSHDGKRF